MAVLVRNDNPGTSEGHVCLLPLSFTHTLPTHCNIAITEMGGWKRLILEVFFNLCFNHCKFAIADMEREGLSGTECL